MFPPVNAKNETKEEYNDFNFWKQDLPQIEIEIEDDEDSDNEIPQSSGYPFYHRPKKIGIE